MEENTESNIKRFYTGWRAIKDVIASLANGGNAIDITAVEIARANNFNPKSVRISAKRMGVTLKADKRGGRRTPCNQHKTEPQCEADTPKEKPSVS